MTKFIITFGDYSDSNCVIMFEEDGDAKSSVNLKNDFVSKYVFIFEEDSDSKCAIIFK